MIFLNLSGWIRQQQYVFFLKQALIQRKIPFEIIQDNSFYSEKNMNALEHSKNQMENGQHSIHELVEV